MRDMDRLDSPMKGHNLKQSRFPLSIRKYFCLVRMVELWHSWPRRCRISPFGNLQKPSGVMGHPVLSGLDGPRGPYQCQPSCDSVTGLVSLETRKLKKKEEVNCINPCQKNPHHPYLFVMYEQLI